MALMLSAVRGTSVPVSGMFAIFTYATVVLYLLFSLPLLCLYARWRNQPDCSLRLLTACTIFGAAAGFGLLMLGVRTIGGWGPLWCAMGGAVLGAVLAAGTRRARELDRASRLKGLG